MTAEQREELLRTPRPWAWVNVYPSGPGLPYATRELAVMCAAETVKLRVKVILRKGDVA